MNWMCIVTFESKPKDIESKWLEEEKPDLEKRIEVLEKKVSIWEICNISYKKEQTENICLEAVKNNGDALQYVNSSFFDEEILELTLEEIANKFNIDVKNIKIKK